jgi:hypothetical protein
VTEDAEPPKTAHDLQSVVDGRQTQVPIAQRHGGGNTVRRSKGEELLQCALCTSAGHKKT